MMYFPKRKLWGLLFTGSDTCGAGQAGWFPSWRSSSEPMLFGLFAGRISCETLHKLRLGYLSSPTTADCCQHFSEFKKPAAFLIAATICEATLV